MARKILLIGICVLLLSFLLLAGCEAEEEKEEGPEYFEPVEEPPVAPVEPPVEEVDLCVEWAESQIPSSFTFYEGANNCVRVLEQKWTDGTPVMLSGDGVKYWEGVNRRFQILEQEAPYYFLKTYGGDIIDFKYEKNYEVKGVVKGTDTFTLKIPILKRIDSSMKEGEELDCVYYDYQWDESEIVDCSKYSEDN